jgi:hypothetical protein
MSTYLGEFISNLLDSIEKASTINEKEVNKITLGAQNLPKVRIIPTEIELRLPLLPATSLSSERSDLQQIRRKWELTLNLKPYCGLRDLAKQEN